MTRPIYPVPEATDGEKWILESDNREAHTDIGRKVMTVPITDSRYDQYVRNHEMAHAKWSPKSTHVKGIDDGMLQVAEDMRMNIKLKKAGIDIGFDVREEDPNFDKKLQATIAADPTFGTKAAVAYYGTGSYGAIAKHVRKSDLAIAKMANEQMMEKRRDPLFADTKRVAQFLSDMISKRDELDDAAAKAAKDGEAEPTDDAMAEGMDEGMEIELTDTESAEHDLGRGPRRRGKGQWGRMHIHEPNRTKRFRPKMDGRKTIYSDTGVVPNAIHRYCTDRQIFGRTVKKRESGGAVLIDVSGSMHIDTKELQQWLNENPAGTVAAYGACNGSKHSKAKYHGGLVVIAKDGKMVDWKAQGKTLMGFIRDAPYIGGANVVDGPALDWLGKQDYRGGRFWVCDGVVTGTGPGYEEAYANLNRDARNKCMAYGIKRVEGIDELLR